MRSVAVGMVGVRHVVMHMPEWVMLVPVTVFAGRHWIVAVVMVAIVMAVRMFVLHRRVRVLDVFSCYSAADLRSGDDPHDDKDVHLRFNEHFSRNPD